MLQENRRYSNDRFIPRRAGINIDALNYMLLKDCTSSSTESESSTEEHKRFCNKAYVKWQRKMLSDRIWATLSIPNKILNFSESKPNGKKSKVKCSVWPVRARSKPLLGSPSIVLDMPAMEGNIYHNCTDWSNTGYLASVFSGEVFLWHSQNHNPKIVTNTGGNVTKCVKWSKNNPIFAMAMNEKLIYIFDCKQNKLIRENFCSCCFLCNITAMEWTKSDYLIAGCSKGDLTVFDSRLKIVKSLTNAHEGIIIRISLSCSETYIATSGEDKNVRVWTWPNLKEHFQISFNSPVRGIAWHPWRNSYFAVGGGYGNGSLSAWNAASLSRLGYRSPSDNDAISIDNLTWNPLTGELVVSYWLRRNGNEQNSIVVLSNLTTEVDTIEWHTGRVLFLLWGNDGATLATAGTDENLCMWEFLGNSFNIKKFKNLNQERKIVTDIFDTTKIFRQCIR